MDAEQFKIYCINRRLGFAWAPVNGGLVTKADVEAFKNNRPYQDKLKYHQRYGLYCSPGRGRE